MSRSEQRQYLKANHFTRQFLYLLYLVFDFHCVHINVYVWADWAVCVSIWVSQPVSEPVLLYANVFHTTCNKTNNDKVKYFNGHNPCRVKPPRMATV